jgi:alkaline phosphatase D
VTDLVWQDNKAYDSETGSGSIGVEFAGKYCEYLSRLSKLIKLGSAVTSPSPVGANITVANADNLSNWLVDNNPELHWNDLYYRGYYELHISPVRLH